MIRAVYRSCRVDSVDPPYDNITLKIHYRAAPDDSEAQNNSGIVPPFRSDGPGRVVIIMPGINVGPECYGWLARKIAQAGMIAVTYSWVAEEMPGHISLTPGINLQALTPDRYGKQPSAHGLGAMLETLSGINAGGVLADCLDLDQVILTGHSAGGSLAMFNARPDWFPSVRGAFTYGAHAGASTQLGYPPDTVLPLPDALPLVMVGGNRDGVISASAGRYGSQDPDPMSRLRQTFDRSLSGARGDCHLVEVEGANHFSLAYPLDDTTGRPFLDHATTRSDSQIRDLLAALLVTFVDSLTGADVAGVAQWKDHELIASLRTR